MKSHSLLSLCGLCLLGVVLFLAVRSSAQNNMEPQPNNGPKVVARINLVNQNAQIPTTTLYVVSDDGLYRISAYAVGTVSDPSFTGFIDPVFQWTDDLGLTQIDFIRDFIGGGTFFGYDGGRCVCGFSSTHFVIRAKTGTPIIFFTRGSDSVTSIGNAQFSVFLAVERL